MSVPLLHRGPLLLTALRAVLGPGLVLLARWYPVPALLGACLVAGLVSDVIDGMIARRLGIATPGLRRLDSIADTIFYLGVLVAAWHLHQGAILALRGPIGIVLALEGARYLYDFVKFGREASYHSLLAKVWGVALFIAFFRLLALGEARWSLSFAVWLGIVANVEGLVISWLLREWTHDVPTIGHAWRLAHATVPGGRS